MRIIILEGIATSGKTSVKTELERLLDANIQKHVFVSEDETLMPILHNTDPAISSEHVTNVLNKYTATDTDFLIFDRLYLTHIWRTKSEPSIFEQSAKILARHETLLCFLYIPTDKVYDRIKLAMSHRDENWNDYVKTKGQTLEEIIKYYVNQQNDLTKILESLPIPHQTFDSSNMDFSGIAKQILQNI